MTWENMRKPEEAPQETNVLVLCRDEWNTWYMVGVVTQGYVIPDYGPVTPVIGWWPLPPAKHTDKMGEV